MSADQPPKVVLCTGSNRGLGFEILHVAGLRDPSAIYILASRKLTAGHEAVEELRQLGVKSHIEVLELDVTNDEHIVTALEFVKTKYGKLDVLINNAGINVYPADKSLASLRQTYNEILNTNITSVAVVTTAFLPLLHRALSPKVINISSGLGSMTYSKTRKTLRAPPYGASKVGMNGLTVHMQLTEDDRVAAEEANNESEGKKDGIIRFYAVAPGLLKTAFTGFIASGKDPKDGAEVVVRLLCDEEGTYEGGTFWELKEEEMRRVPW